MIQKVRYKNLEDFDYDPNVMRNTKVCAKCGKQIMRKTVYYQENTPKGGRSNGA